MSLQLWSDRIVRQSDLEVASLEVRNPGGDVYSNKRAHFRQLAHGEGESSNLTPHDKCRMDCSVADGQTVLRPDEGRGVCITHHAHRRPRW